MRLCDLEDDAAVAFADEREARDDFTCTDGDAESDGLEEALDAMESRALEEAALRGGMAKLCMCV